MRLGLIVLFVALLLAIVAGQNTLLQSTDAESTSSAITACAVQGGSCSPASLDSFPGAVLEHTVFAGGCAQTDLHVLRYLPADSPNGEAAVATWCG